MTGPTSLFGILLTAMLGRAAMRCRALRRAAPARTRALSGGAARPPELAAPWQRASHAVSVTASTGVLLYLVLEHDFFNGADTEHVFSPLRRWYAENVRALFAPGASGPALADSAGEAADDDGAERPGAASK